MIHQAERAPRPDSESTPEITFVDQSQFVRQKLINLLDRDGRFHTTIDGLYLVMPDQECSGTRVIDKGCRGNWTEDYTTNLTDQPAKIASIAGRHHTISLKLSGGSTTNLSRESIDSALFYIDPTSWTPEMSSSPVNDDIHSRLSAQPYGLLTGEQTRQLTDWQHHIQVRSQSPLDHPITYPGRRGGIYQRREILDGSFARVETVHDSTSGTTLAQVVLEEDGQGTLTATDWVPLEQLNFYETETYRPAAYDAHVGRLALALIEGSRDTSAINQLLGQVPSHYDIRGRNMDDYGTWRVATGRYDHGAVTDISAVQIRKPEHLKAVTISAAQVTYDHDYPWVVSQSGLAVPLHRPHGFNKDRTQDSLWQNPSLESLIAEAKGIADN